MAEHHPRVNYEQSSLEPTPIPRVRGTWTIDGVAFTGVATALRNRLADNTGQVILVAADVPSLRRAVLAMMASNLMGPAETDFNSDKVVQALVVSPKSAAKHPQTSVDCEVL